MKYTQVQRCLSIALLLAFTVPSSLAYSTYNSGYSANTSDYSAKLTGDVRLTQRNDKITLSLRDSDVKQVIRMFADKAGKNVVFHSSVEGKITLDMVDMPINDAFSLVLQVAGLNYYIKDNTLIVLGKDSSDNANFSKQEMMTFPVQYVSAAKVANFLNKNIFSSNHPGVSGGDAATVNSATNEVIVFGMPSDAEIVRKVIAQLDKQPASRLFNVNHTTPAEMADMICNMLLPANGAESSGSSGDNGSYVTPTPGVGTGGAAGIMTGGASEASGGSGESSVDQLKLGEGVVACTVTQSGGGENNTSFDSQNIAISYYPSRGSIMMIGGSVAQQRLVEEFIMANDVKQQQAYLEMSIVELNESGMKEFQNNWRVQSNAWGVSFSNGVTSGGRESSPEGRWYDVVYNHLEPGYQDKDGKYNPPVFYSVPGKKENLYKSGSYISWTMNYLIENRKARVLANPKILITNGQQSVIDLTEDYIEKVTSEFMSSTQNGNGATGTVQKTYTIGEDKGIKIALIPFISPDGYVTMNIKPQYATEAGNIYSTNADGTKDIAATLLNRRNLDLKNVRIKDGETLVIGGLIQEVEQKVVQKIPVLGDLPLVGAAFRSTSTQKTKSELIIMITPRILKDGDDAVADRL